MDEEKIYSFLDEMKYFSHADVENFMREYLIKGGKPKIRPSLNEEILRMYEEFSQNTGAIRKYLL